MSFKLGKEYRLKSRKLIGRLFSEGKHISAFPVRTLYLFTPNEVVLQAGFSASSRNFKKAVDRNRLKRLMREAYRKNKNVLEETLKLHDAKLILFFIYTGKEVLSYDEVSTAITRILNSISKITHERLKP